MNVFDRLDIAPGLRVTFSAGVSLCTEPGRLDAAIEAADQAMYRAKASGRDRTVDAEADAEADADADAACASPSGSRLAADITLRRTLPTCL